MDAVIYVFVPQTRGFPRQTPFSMCVHVWSAGRNETSVLDPADLALIQTGPRLPQSYVLLITEVPSSQEVPRHTANVNAQ